MLFLLVFSCVVVGVVGGVQFAVIVIDVGVGGCGVVVVIGVVVDVYTAVVAV